MGRKESCIGCNIMEPQYQPTGGVIEVGKYWLVNQYGGGEGFLGWLALQPREHRMQLGDLSAGEARELGIAVQKVKKALQDYWKKEWPEDRFERLYVTYFFESAFDNSPSKYHLHIHLIPRTKRMRHLLITKNGKVNCWKVHRIYKRKDFPQEYLWRGHEERAERLMSALKGKVSF
jgi:diadenosine tetraphosphate (Ap4A) HIT family hydrolase